MVDGGGLVVACGEAAPLLEFVDAALDGVPLLVGGLVEGGWAASGTAPSPAVRDLVGRLRDDCPDPAVAQVVADRAGRIRLVGQDGAGPNPWPSALSWDSDLGHDQLECGRVSCLARRQDEGEGPAAAVRGEVDFGGQSAAGPSEGMVGGLAGRGPF